MNDLEDRVRRTLENHAGIATSRPMPQGTLRSVRIREGAFVAGVAILAALAVVAGVVLLDAVPRGGHPDRQIVDDGFSSPLENVPPGWPKVQIADPRTAYLPAVDDPDVTDGPVALASGTVEGSAFTLYAYTVGRGDAATACLGFVGFAAPGDAASAAPNVVTCSDSPAVPDERDVAFIGSESAERPGLVAAFGFASSRVDRIFVWGGGGAGMFPIEPLPGLEGWDVSPFVFVPAADAGPMEVDAIVDGDGVMPLAHAEICRPVGVSGTCQTDVLQDLPVDSPIDVPLVLAPGAWPDVTFGGEFEPYVDHEANAEGVVDPEVVGTKTVIAYGTVQGAPWSLVAYNTRDGDAPGGVNPSSQLFGTGVGGGGASLYVTQPWSPNDLDAGRMSSPGVGFDTIEGVVSPRVAAVRLELDDGTVREQRLIAGPDGVEAWYFVDFIPSGLTARVVALDAAGNEIERSCLAVIQGAPPGEDSCAS